MSLAVRIGSLASLYALREPSQSKSIWDVAEGAVTAADRPDGTPDPSCHWSIASTIARLVLIAHNKGVSNERRTV
jgi:hypothetical protein